MKTSIFIFLALCNFSCSITPTTNSPVDRNIAHIEESPTQTGVEPTFERITDETYNQKIEAEGNKCVIINFTATWCGACKRMYPYLNELDKNPPFPLKIFAAFDTENKPKIRELGVDGYPYFFMYINGKKRTHMLGGRTPEGFLKWLKDFDCDKL